MLVLLLLAASSGGLMSLDQHQAQLTVANLDPAAAQFRGHYIKS